MKYLFTILLSSFLYLASFAQHEGHNMAPAKQESASKVIYTCPMHPKVQSDKPGKCPICGMDLVKKTIKVTPSVPKKTEAPKPNVKPVMPSGHDMKSMEKNHKADNPQDKKEMKMHDNHEMGDSSGTGNLFEGKINLLPGKTIRYDLYVTDTIVNFTGKRKPGLAINGTIPAPDLVFTEGDTAEIYVHNKAKTETSIHWHGVILPNQFDGVPYLTTQPIATG